ncbi:hypothetical protein DRN72_00415 [Methanosarcinales archaeon]|nr:MAG: hypothetical protein DRN72_00415 [Methanosarcinales archaeon]
MKPIAIFEEKEYIDGRPRDAITIILKTVGCYRAREGKSCLMCGFIRDCVRRVLEPDEIVSQIDFDRIEEGMIVKIFTSGSFFD